MAYEEGDFRQDILQYAGFMRALALALVRDPDKADDLVQGAMLRAIECPPENRTRSSVRAFLRTMIHRDFWRLHRTDTRVLARERAVARSEELPDVPTSMQNDSVVLALTPAIEALPPKLKAVVTRTYFRGLRPGQIATELDIKRSEVNRRHNEALEKIRNRLDREFHDRDTWRAALLPICLARPASVPVASSGAGAVVAAGVAVVALVCVGVFLVSRGTHADSALEGSRVAKASAVETSIAPRAAAVPAMAFDEEATESIRGRVVDASTGEGIDGLRLSAVPTARPLPRETGPDDAFVVADADGRFEIPLRPGRYDVVFEGDFDWSPSLVADIPVGSDVRLELEGASTLIGAVTDSEGRAVRAGSVHWAGVLDTVRIQRSAKIASNGTYRMRGLPSRTTMHRLLASAGGVSAMKVVANGFAPTAFEVTGPWLGDGRISHWVQDVWLTRAAAIEVEVVDDRGVPVRGAEVSLVANGFSQADDMQKLVGNARRVRETTDASGRAVLDAPTVGATGTYGRIDPQRPWAVVPSLESLLPLQYTVSAWSASHGAGVRKIQISREGESVSLRIAIPSGRRVVGQLSFEDGTPASGIEVAAVPKDHRAWFPVGVDPEAPGSKATSRDDGVFVFECLPVSIDESVEYAFKTSQGEVVDYVFAADPPKTPVDLGKIGLSRSEHAPQRMRVLDADGRPIEGASVLEWRRLAEPRERAAVRTDAEGYAPFPADRSTAVVRAEGYAVVMVKPPAKDDVTPVEVRLAREAVLEGRLVWVAEDGSAGEPYAFAPVEIRNRRFAYESMTPPPTLGRVVTDAEGRFRVDELPSGTWQLAATDWRADCAEFDVSTDEELETLLVGRSNSMEQCRVELTDRGQPVVGAVVRLRVDDRAMSFAELEPGVHVRGNLEAGRYEVDVRHSHYEPKRMWVEIGADAHGAIQLELEPSSLVVVVASGPESEQVDTLFLTDTEFGGEPTRFDRTSDGEFLVRGIRPGVDHRMEFRRGNARWAAADSAPLRIESGDSDRRMLVEIVRASRVHFSGTPLSTRRFEAMTPDERALLQEHAAACEVDIVGPDGAFWFSGSVESLIRTEFLTLPPGDYRCIERLSWDPDKTRIEEFRIDPAVRDIPKLSIGEP